MIGVGVFGVERRKQEQSGQRTLVQPPPRYG
jgi:hypothetical protein